MKFLVTVGEGFIRSNIVEILSDCWEVAAIDDLSSGNMNNIKALLAREHTVSKNGLDYKIRGYAESSR